MGFGRLWVLAVALALAVAFLPACGGKSSDDDSTADDDNDASPLDDDDNDNDNDDLSPDDDASPVDDDSSPVGILDYVNPFIGSGGIGYQYAAAYPGAKYPHGMITMNPNTTRNGFNWDKQEFCGYNWGDPQIRGFVHTELYGTGAAGEGSLLIMPMKSKPNGLIEEPTFRSSFDKSTETATPGYYSAYLEDAQTLVELAAAPASGIERFTFAAGASPYIIVWPSYSQDSGWITDSEVDIGPGQTISGWINYGGPMRGRSTRGSASGYTVYYYLVFSQPFTDTEVWTYGGEGEPGTSMHAADAGAFVGFAPSAEPLVMQVGISSQSVAQAQANLAAQIPVADFDTVHAATRAAWENALSEIEVVGGTDTLRREFYTALYHQHMMPTDWTEANNQYFGFDRQAHDAGARRYYTDMSLWDIFRTQFPFYVLLEPVRAADIAQSLTDMYNQVGYLPRWPAACYDTGSMIETPTDIIFSDAYLKGVQNFDYQTAYQACYAHATGNTPGPGRECLTQYMTLHYLPEDQCGAGVSHITEACREDAALSHWAAAMGNTTDAAMFLARSTYYQNHFDASTGFLRAKDSDGSWVAPFLPAYPFDNNYVEGDAWQYTFCAEHDADGLTALFGSPAAAASKLEQDFQESVDNPPGLVLPSGYYWAGNEPDIFYAFFFDLMGRPDLTQKWTRWIVATKYGDGPAGLPGNDDGGTISAWLLWAAIGFYPVNGSDVYLLGSPLFDQVTMHLPGGDLIVIAHNNTPENKYVQSATLNGAPLTAPQFTHAQIVNGATIEMVMGPQPAAGSFAK
jgi:predicted alpha-1,2-mannosidase